MQPRTVVSALSALLALASFTTAQERAPVWNEQLQGPLPRWREGGTPEVGVQPLVPYAIQAALRSHPQLAPQTGLIESPPEYSPSAGVMFRYASGSWASVVIDCVAALTGDPLHDEIAYVVVASQAVADSASAAFLAAGADLSKVSFLIEPTDSIWLRDYGPHFIWQAGALALADSRYYPTRPRDNFIPTLTAEDHLIVPPYAMGLYYSGGNFQPGPNRSGFVTSLVTTDNSEMTTAEIAELYRTHQGIDTLNIMPRLPSSVDGTGHIDMWLYLVDDHTVIISQFLAGSNPTAIQITENAVPYMQALGFTVFRTPAWNVGSTHYTYTNAFRVNDRIFVPIYGPGNPSYLPYDQAALATWASAAGPGVQIVPINCYSIIPAAGAIHCIVMQVPRVMSPAPVAHVIWPCGGEVLGVTSTYDLRWAASDDSAVTMVDLLYSSDGGLNFPLVIATGQPSDGHYAWAPPLPATPQARVRVVAYDARGNQSSAESSANFSTLRARRRVQDFSSGAGVDRWAWGYQSASWATLDGVRHPAGLSELAPGAYAALASSNASGGDTDPNRYVSPIPSSGQESTHVFELTLADPLASVREIEIAVEGYGDDCAQMELYVWDRVAANWCDLRGGSGLNRYAANFAGNRDARLQADITSGPERFVDGNNRLTFLVYVERSGQESFLDYVSVTTIHD